MGPRRVLPEGEGPLSGSRGGRGGGRPKASRGGPARSTRGGSGAGASGRGGARQGGAAPRRAPQAPVDLPAPPETLFLATIPGATPSTWVQRFTSRERAVQLVNHDEAAQAAHLAHDAEGAPLHPLPQLGYVRWLRDGAGVVAGGEDAVGAPRGLEATLRAAGVDPRHVHAVTVYSELPVVCVGRDHLLAAWDADVDGPVPPSELDPAEHMDPARFAPPADPDATPMDSADLPGAGERMALEIVATGVGHVVLPMSVARMFGRKDVVVLPLASELDDVVGMSRADREAAAMLGEPGDGLAGEDAVPATPSPHVGSRHPGWDMGLAWLKAADSPLVQTFVGVARGRRASSSR